MTCGSTIDVHKYEHTLATEALKRFNYSEELTPVLAECNIWNISLIV